MNVAGKIASYPFVLIGKIVSQIGMRAVDLVNVAKGLVLGVLATSVTAITIVGLPVALVFLIMTFFGTVINIIIVAINLVAGIVMSFNPSFGFGEKVIGFNFKTPTK